MLRILFTDRECAFAVTTLSLTSALDPGCACSECIRAVATLIQRLVATSSVGAYCGILCWQLKAIAAVELLHWVCRRFDQRMELALIHKGVWRPSTWRRRQIRHVMGFFAAAIAATACGTAEGT
jgi:hypothetical protein